MKKILFVFTTLIIVNAVSAQNSLNPNEKQRVEVKVKDWGQAAMIITDEVWEKIKPQLVSQIGAMRYGIIRKNYDWKSIPSEMTTFDGSKRKNPETVYKKLDSLRYLTQIAHYELEGSARWAIIEVPYNGNENWDKKCKWDIVYFIISQKEVIPNN